MRIAIAVATYKAGVEDIVWYKEYRQKDHGHNFDRACEVTEERADEFDGEHTDYDRTKLRCRSYPLVDGEIHIEECEV